MITLSRQFRFSFRMSSSERAIRDALTLLMSDDKDSEKKLFEMLDAPPRGSFPFDISSH